MKMEQIEGSETSDFKTQTQRKYPKENILHKEHGESLKSKMYLTFPSGLHTLIPAKEMTRRTDLVRALPCGENTINSTLITTF